MLTLPKIGDERANRLRPADGKRQATLKRISLLQIAVLHGTRKTPPLCDWRGAPRLGCCGFFSVGTCRCSFRSPVTSPAMSIGRGTGQLTRTPLPQANAHAMIRRRAAAAGIATRIGNHTFRATGITAYLKNGGTLEKAAAMANHASTRTTQLYDRRRDEMSLDEVERVVI